MSPVSFTIEGHRSQAEIVEDLRRLLPVMEGVTSDAKVFPFGISVVDDHLPLGGLVAGSLHEILPDSDADVPAALGFATALLARIPSSGPILFVVSPKGIGNHGRSHGHGLNSFGIDPSRLILVETEDEFQALWALEEALRSSAPAAVVGAVDPGPHLKTTRRLHLAAETSGVPIFLLRPARTGGTSAAATRWRIGSAEAALDRFGLLERWRWTVKLERCRNGRQGEWLMEWDHATYRFSLAATLADLALPQSAIA
jgi:protein ImuA